MDGKISPSFVRQFDRIATFSGPNRAVANLQTPSSVDAPESTKEDSGLIDIFAMQQKAHAANEVAVATAASCSIPPPLSEPPPVTRDTNADLAEFAAFTTPWTKKVRPSWIAGGVGALIAIIALVSFTGGESKDAKSAAGADTANAAPATPPPRAPEMPVATPPAPPPPAAVAAAPAATEHAKESTKPVPKKRAKAKKPSGSKLQKISSAGVSG